VTNIATETIVPNATVQLSSWSCKEEQIRAQCKKRETFWWTFELLTKKQHGVPLKQEAQKQTFKKGHGLLESHVEMRD
jgi:hypothetical protein